MAFDAFLGNDRMKENLSASLKKGHISHFYLISGPRGSGKKTLAKLISAAVLCQGREKPCFSCAVCRKVMENNHPDMITVEDPEHKAVAVKIVRQVRDDVFIRPNESDHKIYIFPQELGTEGQNALLKILEEPPKYGVFLLLTDNPEKILPTVRSRCTELKLLPLPEAVLRRSLSRDFPEAQEADITAAMVRSGGYLGQAREILASGDALPPQTESFVRSLAQRNKLELAMTLAPMEKWKRDALVEILQSWLEILESALACRTGGMAASNHARQLAQSRSSSELYHMALELKKTLEYAKSNVSPAAICGYLLWALG